MKIWYQSATDFGTHSNYARALSAHAGKVASAGTHVTFHGREFGHGGDLPMSDLMSSPAVYHAAVLPEFISALLTAEDEGADVFIIGSFSEPLLAELRSMARIPVVSISEATFLAAMTVAPRLGFITLSPIIVNFVEKSLAAHGIASRSVGVEIVDQVMSEEDLDSQFAKPADYLERLKHAARQSIAAGAQVIVPAEGLVSLIAASNGVSEIDGVPLIDATGTAILFAEFQHALKIRTGVSQSRKAYPEPSDAAREFLFTDGVGVGA